MTIACKLWLLAVVCTAFLYQDGPQGNGVLCGKKVVTHSDEDNSSGAQSASEAQSSGEDDKEQYSDDQSDDSSGGNDSDGGGVGKSNESSDDDDDDDDENHNKKSKNTTKKNKNKHTTNKKSGHGKNHHDDEDDDDKDDEEHVEDDEDNDDDAADTHDKKHKESHKKSKKNKDDEIGEVQVLTTTTITGKPKDVLKFLNKGVKPYKPVFMDFDKKSNSKLFKKIEAVTKRNESSKDKKEPQEDLTSFMSDILKESLKKKNSKQVDPDKVLMTVMKSVLLQLLKDM